MISATSSGKHIFAEQPFPNCYRFFCTFYDKFKTQTFFFHFIFRLLFADHNDPCKRFDGRLFYSKLRTATVRLLTQRHLLIGKVHQKYNYRLRFSPPSLTLTGLSRNTCFHFSGFKKFLQEVTSVGCNWLISIHVVYFVSW